jgi:enamine deaminase RidA (YjgF/YER057c/UK114 family)
MIEHLGTPAGLAPANGYSHVLAGAGRLVVVSGQVAFDETGAVVGVGDPLAQAEQVFANIGHALAAAGATFGDVVKFGVFTTDIAFLPAVRQVRDRHVDLARPPASTAVQVVALAWPELLLEIEALAIV